VPTGSWWRTAVQMQMAQRSGWRFERRRRANTMRIAGSTRLVVVPTSSWWRTAV
jgi:hypothetical protein